MSKPLLYRPISPLAPASQIPGWRSKPAASPPATSLPKEQGTRQQQRSFEPESLPDTIDEWRQEHRTGYHGP